MNTAENNTENTPADRSRPFGFWLTAADRLMAAQFATAFEDEGITRRDWRILNVIDGTAPAGRELPAGKVRHLVELGWVEPGSEGWALTTDGAAAKARLTTAVEEIRAQVAGALDPEEFAAMAASLEKLARGLGYEEGMRLPRRRAGERREGGHGPGHHGHHHGRGDHRRSYGEHGERQHGEHSREHRHGEHSRGMGPGRGFHRHTPEQIHIHLHDGRHDG